MLLTTNGGAPHVPRSANLISYSKCCLLLLHYLGAAVPFSFSCSWPPSTAPPLPTLPIQATLPTQNLAKPKIPATTKTLKTKPFFQQVRKKYIRLKRLQSVPSLISSLKKWRLWRRRLRWHPTIIIIGRRKGRF